MEKIILILMGAFIIGSAKGCGPGLFLCHSSDFSCINASLVCNTVGNCPLFEDEFSCDPACPGEVFCPSSGSCVTQHQICSNIVDCPQLLLSICGDVGSGRFPPELIPSEVPMEEITFNCSSFDVSARIPASFIGDVDPALVDFQFVDDDLMKINGTCYWNLVDGFYIVTSEIGSCIAQRLDNLGFVVDRYKIRIGVDQPPSMELINRDFQRTVINFECEYLGDSTVTLGRPLVPVFTDIVTDVGSLEMNFRIKLARYESPDFSTISTDSNIFEGSTVFIAMTLEQAFGYMLQPETCTLAANEDGSGSSFPVLQDGCPTYDQPSVNIQLYPQRSAQVFAFSFSGFLWNGISDENQNLWLSCEVKVCAEHPGNCSLPCLIPMKRRRSLEHRKKTGKEAVISLGPFNFQESKKNNEVICDKEMLGCSHHCNLNEVGEGVCACPGGFVLLDDMKTCYELKHPPIYDDALLLTSVVLFFLILLVGGIVLIKRQGRK